MKKNIAILIGPLLLWACSVDPHQGVSGQGPQSQANAEHSGNEGIVDSGDSEGKVASGGTVVDMPVEVVNPGNSGGSQPVDVPAQVPPIAQVPEVPKGAEENEHTVTPPGKITGAFLVGEVIPNEEGDAGRVLIGIVAKQDDIRLTSQPDRFTLNWGLSADVLLENSIRLLPTKNAAYDRILEFDGTIEELESFEASISIQLSVSEDAGAGKLESVVKSKLSDLFSPVDEELSE